MTYLRLIGPPTLAYLVAVGCGGGGGSGEDSGLGAGDAAPDPDAGVGPARALVIYCFDQSLGAIFRLEDHNGDGDMHDAGEAVRFFDGSVAGTGIGASLGLLALSPHALLATSDFAGVDLRTDNVVAIDDLDRNGDGLGDGESKLWFAGALPGGLHLGDPLALAAGPGAAVYLADSNADDPSNPFGIYKLADTNGDGDVDDAGEHALVLALDPPTDQSKRTDDLAVDTDGRLWLWEVGDPSAETLYSIDPGAPTLHPTLTSQALDASQGLVLLGDLSHLGRLAGSGELVFQAFKRSSGFATLVAAQDSNGDGMIDPAAEVRILWDEELHFAEPSNVGAGDLALAADGSVLVLVANQGTIHRLRDENGDGDLDDPGEDHVVYDTAQSVASGGENTSGLLSLAVTLAAP